MNDKNRLRHAFNEMRKAGVKASLGINSCCRSCIWAEREEEWSGSPVVWFYTGQGNKLVYDDEGNLESHKAIYLNHNAGEFRDKILECVGILKEAGLDAKWDGEETKCIEVSFS
ncbi:MAG: hypothetical protein EBW33_06260 [Actinobacteria bacterium]|jgi:hypothetical protein|nr:hypothetical protein [Actinomycetota bacterium]NCV96313.1 hypothetical protein [Actinomycetota bacterium]